MVVGHGVDVVGIARIESMLASHGERFTRRCFTEGERAYADAARRRRAERYAARFAAKEAVLKTLGTGLRHGIRWTDIEVIRDGPGRPHLLLTDRAKAIADELGIGRWHLSLTHAGDQAIASVVAERGIASASVHAHRTLHSGRTARFAIVTISDTRTRDDDVSGTRAETLCLEAGHRVAQRDIVQDDAALIRPRLDELVARPDVDAIITTGGTGLARRDVTVGVIRELIAIEIEGFGELFRHASYESIGPAAMLSRALGGLAANGTVLFALPGSPHAVELALTRFVLPEIAHCLGIRDAGGRP